MTPLSGVLRSGRDSLHTLRTAAGVLTDTRGRARGRAFAGRRHEGLCRHVTTPAAAGAVCHAVAPVPASVTGRWSRLMAGAPHRGRRPGVAGDPAGIRARATPSITCSPFPPGGDLRASAVARSSYRSRTSASLGPGVHPMPDVMAASRMSGTSA